MRLYLLPISTRRTLIYCQKLEKSSAAGAAQKTWLDKGTVYAANLWAGWEKKESGWQKKVVDYGNQALKRIPYEEWGLKSIPPLSAKRKAEEIGEGKAKTEVDFPPSLIPESNVLEVLRKLGTERQAYHKRMMKWCFVGMPISAPVAIIPVIPNLPFFYLVFRAWSHWRALSGSKHIQFLLENNLIKPSPSKILDELYSSSQQPFAASSPSSTENAGAKEKEEEEERMVLHKSSGKPIAAALGIPELNVELDRAVWQVERALKAEKERAEEKANLDKANAKPK